MKTKNTNTRKNKFLRIGASGILLAILFVFVFAGVLSASFAVERNAIETGQLEANVASAAGTWNEGVSSFDNGITSYNVWDKVDFGTFLGASDNRNRTLSASGDLKDFIEKGIIKLRLYHYVQSKSKNYTFTFTVKQTNNAGTQMLSQSHKLDTDSKPYTSGWYDSNTISTFYFYCSSGGSSTAWSDVRNIRIEFASKAYTIAINHDGGTGGSGNQSVNGGVVVSNITPASKAGYTLLGYFIDGDSSKMLYNASGQVQANVTGYTDGSKRWIKNSSSAVSVKALYAEHFTKLTYNKNEPVSSTANNWNGGNNNSYEKTHMYGTSTAFTIEDGTSNSNHMYGTNYTFIGWNTSSSATTAAYVPGESHNMATSSDHFYLGTTTTPNSVEESVHAIWIYIAFTFGNGAAAGTGGEAFTVSHQYSPANALSILKGVSGYLAAPVSNLPSGYSSTIEYSTQNL